MICNASAVIVGLGLVVRNADANAGVSISYLSHIRASNSIVGHGFVVCNADIGARPSDADV